MTLTTVLIAASLAIAPAPASQAERSGHEHAATERVHAAPPRSPLQSGGGIGIPEALRADHEEIHAALVRATHVPGKIGAAARELANTLHAHFVREEEIALPPLGLVAPLARRQYDRSMDAVLEMTSALRTELPRMLREHAAIAAAARRLETVARAERNVPVERLAKRLQLHARAEEELYYPAALLVGDVVRDRSAAAGDRGPRR